MPHSLDQRADVIRRAALDEGFSHIGFTPAVEATGYANLARWIEAGFAGEMSYFAGRREAYRHPRSVLEGVRSIVALAYPYPRSAPSTVASGVGRVARYAWEGTDYHDTIHPKLKRICRELQQLDPETQARGVVDTAPLMEREIAELAGLGWRGKNTLLLNNPAGSYFFLACVLTDAELPASVAVNGHCGTCTACLDACPTNAFPEAGVLDASRCISYLTIEHRGHIDVALRPAIGDWLFGCDICQEVCPWNTKPSRAARHADWPLQTVDLVELFSISDEGFRAQFRKTPLWRTRRRGLLRNAAIVLGNQRHQPAVPALISGLADPEPIVRAAAAWALAQIGGEQAERSLRLRLAQERDPIVIAELNAALR